MPGSGFAQRQCRPVFRITTPPDCRIVPLPVALSPYKDWRTTAVEEPGLHRICVIVRGRFPQWDPRFSAFTEYRPLLRATGDDR